MSYRRRNSEGLERRSSIRELQQPKEHRLEDPPSQQGESHHLRVMAKQSTKPMASLVFCLTGLASWLLVFAAE
jgi:hypothetical protein